MHPTRGAFELQEASARADEQHSNMECKHHPSIIISSPSFLHSSEDTDSRQYPSHILYPGPHPKKKSVCLKITFTKMNLTLIRIEYFVNYKTFLIH